jgi:hypothetical protein
MRRHLRPEDVTPAPAVDDAADLQDLSLFAEDLRAAYPPSPLPERMVEDHVVAMMEAVQAAGAVPTGASTPWRERMLERMFRPRERMFRRVVAVAAGSLLSLGGLAIAGAFPGGDDPADDDLKAIVTQLPGDDEIEDANEVEDADESEDADENEDADDQGEDGDDQGENEEVEEAEPEDEGEDGDDQGENEGADDQGEDEADEAEVEDDGGDDGDEADHGDADEDGGDGGGDGADGGNGDDQGED